MQPQQTCAQAAAADTASPDAAANGTADYTALTADTVYFRPPVLEQDVEPVAAAEAASYPEDEAATAEKLRFRMQHAAGLFLLAVRSGPNGTGEELLGYACGTLSNADKLTHESMSQHDPDGTLLCIHSVCVRQHFRRQGIATRLLRAYLSFVQATTPQLAEVRLICKQDLVELYRTAGFVLLGPSEVVHGKDPWLEMAVKCQ